MKHDAIMRRACRNVIQNVMRITGMDETDNVDFRGDYGIAKHPGGSMGTQGKNQTYPHDGRIIVNAKETYRESEVINSAVREPDAQPIFLDQSLGIVIKPVYSATDVELSFTFRAKTKTEAQNWRDDIKVRMADNRQQHLHELEYHFPVPVWCSMFLKHVHTLREAQGGYGQSLGEYLKEAYTKRAYLAGTQDGDLKKTLLVIGEHQIGVQGWFDFQDVPEEDKVGDGGPAWNISFTYRFNYKKPVEINAQYPLVIHNQLIDAMYIPNPQEIRDPDKVSNYRGSYKFALDTFDYEARTAPRPNGGIMIPEFDEWIPDAVPNYTTSLITWMTFPQPADLQLVFSEEDVLTTGFDPSILAYMRRQGQKLVKRGQAAIHFCLYRDNDPIADGDLVVTVTERGFEIRTKSVPDIRLRYHMRMSFCTSYALYTEEALEELHQDGYATLRMFQTVVNKLDVETAQKEHMTDGTLSVPYIKWFFKFLRNQQIGYHEDQGGGKWGDNLNNDVVDDPTWLDNNSFFGTMDRPYVEILTILVGRRGDKDASSFTSQS